jgi:hypothetical protein
LRKTERIVLLLWQPNICLRHCSQTHTECKREVTEAELFYGKETRRDVIGGNQTFCATHRFFVQKRLFVQSRLNCKYAEWSMTKHDPPRINKRYGGACVYRVGPLAVPKSVDANELERLVNPYYKQMIDPQNPHTDALGIGDVVFGHFVLPILFLCPLRLNNPQHLPGQPLTLI